MYNGLFINSNQSAVVAENNLQNTNNSLGESLNRLSSGLQITGAWVDPAGYEIAQGLNATVLGINQATSNANNGNSLVNIASGALATIQGMLGTMQSLATNAANGTNSQQNLDALSSEFTQLASEITQISNGTSFNGLNLLNAVSGSSLTASVSAFTFQIGTDANTTNSQISVSIQGVSASLLGLASGGSIVSSLQSVSIDSASSALVALSAVQAAVTQVAGISGQLGSYQNRVTQILGNLQTEGTNTQAAYNNIMDVNFASEMSNFTLLSTLAQSGEAMLSQASMVPQGLLTLLK
ncbi:MAG: flagellin N-terminal helical domain-containing protein [bacterium]